MNLQNLCRETAQTSAEAEHSPSDSTKQPQNEDGEGEEGDL